MNYLTSSTFVNTCDIRIVNAKTMTITNLMKNIKRNDNGNNILLVILCMPVYKSE